jgi:hypothetical protein
LLRAGRWREERAFEHVLFAGYKWPFFHRFSIIFA